MLGLFVFPQSTELWRGLTGSILCVRIHKGVGHTDSESAQHFWLVGLLTGIEPQVFGSRFRRSTATEISMAITQGYQGIHPFQPGVGHNKYIVLHLLDFYFVFLMARKISLWKEKLGDYRSHETRSRVSYGLEICTNIKPAMFVLGIYHGVLMYIVWLNLFDDKQFI